MFLSQSLSKNFVHLMRLTPCHENTSAGRALKLWDKQLDGLMQIIAGTRSMDCLNRGLAALPACQGGLGIMTTADLADPCFIAGKLSVARSLTNCGPVDLSLAVTSLLDLSQTPKYATETEVHSAISRIDELKPGLADKLIESDANATIRHQHTLVANLAEARKADFLAGSSMQTRALVRSNAGNPHALASAHNRSPSTDLSNNDFTIFIRRRLRLPLLESSTDRNGALGLCDGCNKSDCADIYGDSRLACNATKFVTKLWHDPVAQKIAELARLNGLSVSNGIHARPANPNSNIMTDRIISGLLKNGGELHIDVVTTTVTCKSNMRDAAVVDGAAAAKAAAAKVTYHRDNILAANPDNRFAPFAVEEGGRLGADAEALVDAIVRAGSSDSTTWLPTKTYCMRALAATTVRGVARIIGRARLPAPRRRSARAPTGLPTAATLAHIAHIANPPGDTAAPVPPATGDPFPSSSSSSTTTTTATPMQSAAATVGVREVV